MLGQNLAPPPAAPHGPRSPAQMSTHSRTPSPGTPNLEPHMNGDDDIHDSLSLYGSDDDHYLPKPSAKALGKRKVVEAEEPPNSKSMDLSLYDHF